VSSTWAALCNEQCHRVAQLFPDHFIGVAMLPAPETRRRTENDAMVDALAAFKARAKVISDAMGKTYRIKHLAINSSGRMPPIMRSAVLAAADAAPMPIEAGETLVTVAVSGQIELSE